MHLTRHILLAIAFTAIAATLAAQRSDSLSCNYDHSFTWSQTIAPASLLTSGSVIAFSSLHHHWNEKIRDWSQSDGHAVCEVENYIQYVPGASVLLLKACGVESRHSWRDIANLGGGSAILGFGLTQGMKHAIGFERPLRRHLHQLPLGPYLHRLPGRRNPSPRIWRGIPRHCRGRLCGGRRRGRHARL